MTGEIFDSIAISCFELHAGNLLRQGLGIGPAEIREFFGFASDLFRRGEDAFGEISSFLRKIELRDRWNAALGVPRSEALGEWIAPYVKGPALDLLCGSGGVGRALIRRGVDITFTERNGFGSHGCETPCEPLAELQKGWRAEAFDTVLICTNLHHEKDPEELLALGARLARHGLILIENCIDKDFPACYQLLMDLFFNRCLNPNDLGSPGKHRTAAGWVQSAAEYGDLLRVEQRRDIPGIPLGHHLIVLEVDSARVQPSSNGVNK